MPTFSTIFILPPYSMPACFDTWNTYSFLIEMKPKSEFASVFVSCPKSISEGEVEPHGLLKLDEQMIELTIDFKKHISILLAQFLLHINNLL